MYTDFESGDDGLGPVRTAKNVEKNMFSSGYGPGDGSSMTLFDITNVLKGGLDYVQLGRLDPAPGGGAVGFFALGERAPLEVMPTTGSAKYEGGTRGDYTNAAGTVYSTASDVTLTANFGTGEVTGSTSNFKLIDAAGAAVTAPQVLDFDFDATIAGVGFTGTAKGSSMTGAVEGVFHGLSGPPPEASLGFTLQDASGASLVGVGGLRTGD
ncbi:transferrin-binding protein-like solute binding protein [Brevundimonas sp.]|uniref:transferrin-binding protein-like solute binding protein n=1 Tax=Brevundimonas sp. TaxID=1871086 RepID=UPI003BAD85FF